MKTKTKLEAMQHGPDNHTATINKWLKATPKANATRLRKWLMERGHEHGITHLLHGRGFAALRKELIVEWRLK